MAENEYLLLIPSGNIKPLQARFRELGGFYNGLGYAFPQKSETFLREIVSQLPDAKMYRFPLGNNGSFEALHQSHKTSFYQDRLLQVEKEIRSTKLEPPQIAILLEEKERLAKELEWSSGLEKALSTQNQYLDFQFINEKKINYLLDEAPPTPRLINFLENGIQKPLIRKGIAAMLVGAGGAGKTNLLMQLAFSIVTGTNWLDIYPIEKPGAVFAGLGENSEEDLHRLVRKITKKFQKTQKSSDLWEENLLKTAGSRLLVKSFAGIDSSFLLDGKPTALYRSVLATLKSKEPEEGWACLIFDPISRFLGAQAETDNASATQFISLIEQLILELRGKPTVIFGHHMNKSGVSGLNTDQSAARGSSALTDGVRWQANLEKLRKLNAAEGEDQYEPNQLILRFVKSNFSLLLSPQKLGRDEEGCLEVLKDGVPLRTITDEQETVWKITTNQKPLPHSFSTPLQDPEINRSTWTLLPKRSRKFSLKVRPSQLPFSKTSTPLKNLVLSVLF